MKVTDSEYGRIHNTIIAFYKRIMYALLKIFKKGYQVMNCYLIDFENVNADYIRDFLDGYTKYDEYGCPEDPKYCCDSEKDILVIFYSEHCPSIPLDLVESLFEKGLMIRCKMATVGTKNALDFQLSSYLGFLIGSNTRAEKYFIISNDKGYDCLCDYWGSIGIDVERKTVSKQEEKKSTAAKKKSGDTKSKSTKSKQNESANMKEIKEWVSENDQPEEVLKIFNQYKTKQAICNGLSKLFRDSKKTSEVYKKLKPLLKEKNKT
ncbi:MAG: hypothetical protein K6G19_00110 [Lachnospiraceae bacterium]|nr:hypothetical protein [Lachnospiraceae bacterium]